MTRKRIIILVLGVLVLGAIIFGMQPEPAAVDTQAASRGPLEVTVEEEGHTQVVDRYTVSAPVAAHLGRIELRPGDTVELGDALAQLNPPRASLLDPRSQAEATERVSGARAAFDRAQQQVRAAEAAHDLAQAERDRTERLVQAGARTPESLERAHAEARRAEAELAAAREQVSAARAELRRARAAAQEGDGDRQADTDGNVLRAPTSGTVLKVHRESEGFVNPGEPLIDIADVSRLEIHAQILSQDAAQIGPGTRVEIDRWGGDAPLEAVVTRVYPEGETTVSALGVEEQRVTVVADLRDPEIALAAGVGTGYRVLARFVVWDAEDVLKVPESALFRTDQGWALFALAGERADLRDVEVGRRTGLEAEIISGIDAGEDVIIYPSSELEDGLRVEPR